MGKEKAVGLYTAVPRMHNCAESVAAGFDRVELMDVMKTSGGGRAPEGMCGALFAAISILPENEREQAVAEFIAAAGSDKCREIKGEHRTPCAKCVEIASGLIEKYSAE